MDGGWYAAIEMWYIFGGESGLKRFEFSPFYSLGVIAEVDI
jgi:hypothetical protein